MFFTLTKLRQLCKEYGLSPSKKYGQNFLLQAGPVQKMLAAAEVSKKDTVIEIGPGFGVLTLALVEQADKVIAFEIEKKLQSYWREQVERERIKNLEIIWGNALNNIQDTTNKIQKYKVIANLPYQITSQVLRTLLELENKPESITIMVQKEVAQRICARAGEMSLLAVSVQYYGEPQVIAKVTKGNFWPEPKVDSAIVHFKTLKHESIKTSDQVFFRVVKAGFTNKRKQLWRNLTKGLGLEGTQVKKILYEVVGNEKVRAEDLTVAQWQTIVNKIF